MGFRLCISDFGICTSPSKGRSNLDRYFNSALDLGIKDIVLIVFIRGIRTLDFSRKTINAVLSDLQIVGVIK